MSWAPDGRQVGGVRNGPSCRHGRASRRSTSSPVADSTPDSVAKPDAQIFFVRACRDARRPLVVRRWRPTVRLQALMRSSCAPLTLGVPPARQWCNARTDARTSRPVSSAFRPSEASFAGSLGPSTRVRTGARQPARSRQTAPARGVT